MSRFRGGVEKGQDGREVYGTPAKYRRGWFGDTRDDKFMEKRRKKVKEEGFVPSGFNPAFSTKKAD